MQTPTGLSFTLVSRSMYRVTFKSRWQILSCSTTAPGTVVEMMFWTTIPIQQKMICISMWMKTLSNICLLLFLVSLFLIQIQGWQKCHFLQQLFCSNPGDIWPPGPWGSSAGGRTGQFSSRCSKQHQRRRRSPSFPPAVPSFYKGGELYRFGWACCYPAAGWRRSLPGPTGWFWIPWYECSVSLSTWSCFRKL